jgi:hypothetical protein
VVAPGTLVLDVAILDADARVVLHALLLALSKTDVVTVLGGLVAISVVITTLHATIDHRPRSLMAVAQPMLSLPLRGW